MPSLGRRRRRRRRPQEGAALSWRWRTGWGWRLLRCCRRRRRRPKPKRAPKPTAKHYRRQWRWERSADPSFVVWLAERVADRELRPHPLGSRQRPHWAERAKGLVGLLGPGLRSLRLRRVRRGLRSRPMLRSRHRQEALGRPPRPIPSPGKRGSLRFLCWRRWCCSAPSMFGRIRRLFSDGRLG